MPLQNSPPPRPLHTCPWPGHPVLPAIPQGDVKKVLPSPLLALTPLPASGNRRRKGHVENLPPLSASPPWGLGTQASGDAWLCPCPALGLPTSTPISPQPSVGRTSLTQQGEGDQSPPCSLNHTCTGPDPAKTARTCRGADRGRCPGPAPLLSRCPTPTPEDVSLPESPPQYVTEHKASPPPACLAHPP